MDPQLSLQMKEILWSTIQTWLIYLEFFVYIWHALFVNLWHALFMNLWHVLFIYLELFVLGYRVFNLHFVACPINIDTCLVFVLCIIVFIIFRNNLYINFAWPNFRFSIHMLQYTFILLTNIPDCLVFVVGCFWVLLLKEILCYTF